MIKTLYAKKDEVKIDKKEVFRYMSLGSSEPSEDIKKITKKCIEDVCCAAEYRACYDVFKISRDDNGIIDLGFMKTSSKALLKNLDGCFEVILFAATAGAAVDRLIFKYSLISPVYALAMQSAGAAAIEGWCDLLCAEFKKSAENENNYLAPRFSPGYGDFALDAQKNIFNVLDCPRKIGLSLTDSLLMTPSKSVSAVIGVTKTKKSCTKHGCDICQNTDCEFKVTEG